MIHSGAVRGGGGGSSSDQTGCTEGGGEITSTAENVGLLLLQDVECQTSCLEPHSFAKRCLETSPLTASPFCRIFIG